MSDRDYVVDGTVEVLHAGRAVQQQEAAALDVQVQTAKAYPRSVDRFLGEIEKWARLDRQTAEQCMYVLDRGGKKIIGPSIRYAELLLPSWGNAVVDCKVIEESDGTVICDGVCRDLERNVAVRSQVRRRIVDKRGKRYPEHVVESTVMAGLAIARRNAILAVVPRVLWESVFRKTKQTAMGDVGDFTTALDTVAGRLKDRGVSEERWLAYIGRESRTDVTADNLLALRIALTSIEDGDETAASLFPEPTPDRNEAASATGDAIVAAAKAAKAGATRTASKAERRGQGVKDPAHPGAPPVEEQAPGKKAHEAPQAPTCGHEFEGPDGTYQCNRKPGHATRHAYCEDPDIVIEEQRRG